MLEWTEDLTIPLPPGRSVAELVVVLQSALGGMPDEDVELLLAAEFGLSTEDVELARDRVLGGLVRAATGNPSNCPPQDEDPMAWESFRRGTQDPSLVARIFPQFGPKQ